MIKLVFDNGKGVIEFHIDGTSILIKDMVSGQEFKANKEMFSTQAKTNRSQIELRRKKGEKFYKLWGEDLKKFCSFDTEKEIEQDIMKDFVEDRGWKLLKREEE